jgi:hypothetical protein
LKRFCPLIFLFMQELKLARISPFFSTILTKMYFFPHLTLKITVKVIYFQRSKHQQRVIDLLKILKGKNVPAHSRNKIWIETRTMRSERIWVEYELGRRIRECRSWGHWGTQELCWRGFIFMVNWLDFFFEKKRVCKSTFLCISAACGWKLDYSRKIQATFVNINAAMTLSVYHS